MKDRYIHSTGCTYCGTETEHTISAFCDHQGRVCHLCAVSFEVHLHICAGCEQRQRENELFNDQLHEV